MSDHLTDARTCVTHASKARDAGSAISWLTDACKQIIAYLETQQAQQDEPWTPDTEDVEFCFDYLEAQNTTGATMTYTPTIEEVREAYDRWLAAHDAEVRAQALREAVASLRAKFGPTNRAADYLARAEQIKEDR